MKFNMNNIIKVKLTDHGKEILHRRYEELSLTLIPKGIDYKFQYNPDDEGYIQFQMWQFMEIFGKYLYVGCEAITEHNEILIPEED